MGYIINDHEPASLFRFFEDIAAIPHGSKNEARVSDFLVEFAGKRGLDCYRDEIGNVLIKMPASPGYENEEAVLFQGHTDMVCEKNNGTEHNFLTDPLKLYIDANDRLHAKGTTLGADDGVAVAAMLAILDGAMEEHPALECLFTVSEEVGLEGAHAFDYSRISARRMINMDVEGEGSVTVGCAGGCRSDISIPVDFVPAAGEAIKLSITGLMGGHSGADIHLGRASANQLMGRILLTLRRSADYNLINIRGGLMDNAIPRECEAVITCADCEAMKQTAMAISAEIASELSADDAGFVLNCEKVATPELMMNCASTRRIADALGTISVGVLRMSSDIEGLVEYSRNIGKVYTKEGSVELVFSSRSANEYQLDESIDYLDALAELCGGRAEHYSRYPGWKYARVSPLRDKYLKVVRNILGREADVVAVHAGLETGIIKFHIPDMDIIAIGPEVENIHTPDEWLDLRSLERFWLIIKELLKK